MCRELCPGELKCIRRDSGCAAVVFGAAASKITITWSTLSASKQVRSGHSVESGFTIHG